MAGPGLAEMNAFVAIVEQRSFARAAVQLGVSASTLSECLRKLEERLAVRLIERTTRSVAPTEAGERLLTRLRPVLEDYEAALESINDFRDKPCGQGHGRPKTPHDLLSRNCIRLRMPSVGLLPWRFAQNGKPFEVAVDGALVVNDVPFALRAARDGLGLLQTHSNRVESFIAQGELETVLDDWAPPRVNGFFLYYPCRRHTRAPLQALVDFLRKAAKVKGAGVA